MVVPLADFSRGCGSRRPVPMGISGGKRREGEGRREDGREKESYLGGVVLHIRIP